MNQMGITNTDFISFSMQEPSPLLDSCFGDMNGHAADNRKKQVKKTPLQVCYPCFKSKKKKYSGEAVPYTLNYGDRNISRLAKDEVHEFRPGQYEQKMQMNPPIYYNVGPIQRSDEPLIYQKKTQVFREIPFENVEIIHFEPVNHTQKLDKEDCLADYGYSTSKPRNGRVSNDLIKSPSSIFESFHRKDENQIKHSKNSNDYMLDEALPVNDGPKPLNFKYKYNPRLTDEMAELIRFQQVSLVNPYSSSLETDKQNAWVDEEIEETKINDGGSSNELTYSAFESPQQNYKHKKISSQSSETISFVFGALDPRPQITKLITDLDEYNGEKININSTKTDKGQESFNFRPVRSILPYSNSIEKIKSSKEDFKRDKISKLSNETISYMFEESERKNNFLKPIYSNDKCNYKERKDSSYEINKSLRMVHLVPASTIKSFSNPLETDNSDASGNERNTSLKLNEWYTPNELKSLSFSGSPKEDYINKKISKQSDETISYMLDEVASKPFIKNRFEDPSDQDLKESDYNTLRTNSIQEIGHLKPTKPVESYSKSFEADQPHAWRKAETISSKSNDGGAPNELNVVSYSTSRSPKEDYKNDKITMRSDENISYMSDLLSPKSNNKQYGRNFKFPSSDSEISIKLNELVHFPTELPSSLIFEDCKDIRKDENEFQTKIDEQRTVLLYNSPRVKPSKSLKQKNNQKKINSPIDVDKYKEVLNLLSEIPLMQDQYSSKQIDSDKEEITAFSPNQRNEKKSKTSTSKSQSLNNINRHVPLRNDYETKIPATSDRGTYIGQITKPFNTLPPNRVREKRSSWQGNGVDLSVTVMCDQAPQPTIPKEILVPRPKPPAKEIKKEYSDSKPKDIPKVQCERSVSPVCPPPRPPKNNCMSRKTLGTFGNEIVRNTFPMFCKDDFYESSKENYNADCHQKQQANYPICRVEQSSDKQMNERIKQFDQPPKRVYIGYDCNERRMCHGKDQGCNDLENHDNILCDEQVRTTRKRHDCSNNCTIKTKPYRYIKDIFSVREIPG